MLHLKPPPMQSLPSGVQSLNKVQIKDTLLQTRAPHQKDPMLRARLPRNVPKPLENHILAILLDRKRFDKSAVSVQYVEQSVGVLVRKDH